MDKRARVCVGVCVCPDLARDFKGFAVGKNANKMKEETVLLANTVRFNRTAPHAPAKEENKQQTT